MPNDMGTFRVDIEVENPARPGKKLARQAVLVDTGAELSWFPTDLLESLGVQREKEWRFRQADGTVLTRRTGWALVYLGDLATVDEVVFGEPGDLVLLGSRTLEGLNLRVDPVSKRLIDAGPAPAAEAYLVTMQPACSMDPGTRCTSPKTHRSSSRSGQQRIQDHRCSSDPAVARP